MENGDVRRLEAAITGAKENLQGQITNLQGQIADMQGQIGNMQGQVADVKGQIAEVKENLQGQIADVRTNLERLIVDFKDSLEREISILEREMREGFQAIAGRFDAQSARLERQGGLIQVGSRWSARITQWSEKVDTSIEREERAIALMQENLRRLENRLDK